MINPQFTEKPAFMVVGMHYIGKNENDEIPQMWGKFWSRVKEIEAWINRDQCYGVCWCAGEDQGFNYMACVEVNHLDNIPEGMIGKEIPAQQYAIFTHHGHVSGISTTYKNAGEWLKTNGYKWADAPDFEFYDERFNPEDMEHSELDIYIPIN